MVTGLFAVLTLQCCLLALASFANWDLNAFSESFLGLSAELRYLLFASILGYWAFRSTRVAMRISELDVCLRGVMSTRHIPLDEVGKFKVEQVTRWGWHLAEIVLVRRSDPREFSLWVGPGAKVVTRWKPVAEREVMGRIVRKNDEAKLEAALEEMNRICDELNAVLRSQRTHELSLAAETNYPY